MMVELDATKAAKYSVDGLRIALPKIWIRKVGLKPGAKVHFAMDATAPERLIVTTKPVKG